MLRESTWTHLRALRWDLLSSWSESCSYISLATFLQMTLLVPSAAVHYRKKQQRNLLPSLNIHMVIWSANKQLSLLCSGHRHGQTINPSLTHHCWRRAALNREIPSYGGQIPSGAAPLMSQSTQRDIYFEFNAIIAEVKNDFMILVI